MSRDGHADHGTAMVMLPPTRGGPHEEAPRATGTPLFHTTAVWHVRRARGRWPPMRGSTMVYGVHHPPLGSAKPKMGVAVMVGQWPSVRARWVSSTS